jgi:hypothetical protein
MDAKKVKTTYQLRLETKLLDDFLELARSMDRSPAAEIRDFMRAYVVKNAKRKEWEGADTEIPF